MNSGRTLSLRLSPTAIDEDDEALATAAGTDDAAFARLYERYYGRVYRYCRTRTASAEDAADVTQHVFTVAYVRRKRYRQRGAGYLAWLLRIARNAAIDARRRGRTSTPIDAIAPPPSRSIGPEDAVLLNEEMRHLRDDVARLPSDQQEVLALRFMCGLPVRAIAGVIGTSESAAQMRLWRALQALRKGRD